MQENIGAACVFALVATFGLGCAAPSPVLPATQADFAVTPATLSRTQLMRAILVRSRIARGGGKPTATLMRKYDKRGTLLSESVLVGSAWHPRRSSIPDSLLRQPLSLFLTPQAKFPTRAGLLMSPTSLRALSTDTGTITLSDTSLTDAGASYAIMTRDATDPDAEMAGEVYWPDSTYVDQLASVIGVSAVIVSPDSSDDGGTLIEVDGYGTDFSDAVNGFIADTTGMGFGARSLLGEPMPPGMSNASGSQRDLFDVRPASALLLATACEWAHRAIYTSGFRAVIWGIFALASAGEDPPIAYYAAKRAFESTAAAAGAYYYYRHYC